MKFLPSIILEFLTKQNRAKIKTKSQNSNSCNRNSAQTIPVKRIKDYGTVPRDLHLINPSENYMNQNHTKFSKSLVEDLPEKKKNKRFEISQ